MGNVRKFLTVILVVITMAFMAFGVTAALSAAFDGPSSTVVVMAEETADASEGETADSSEEEDADGATAYKALAAGLAIGAAALGGAIAMGIAISKSTESIARQPEADGKIRSTLMLGLVFIETAIIYALIVAILIVFVL